MKLVLFVQSCLLVASTALAAKIQISKLTTICRMDDPNLNDCATKSANELLPQMVKGIPDYGLPPIDPLDVPFMQLSQSEGSVGLKLNISDTVHIGMREAKFKSVRLDMKKNTIEADLFMPLYTIKGVCNLGGRILLLPIVGHGDCELTSRDQEVKIKIGLKPEVRNSTMFYKVDKYTVAVTFSKGKFRLSGLFGGNPQLGKAMNRFLNANAVDVLNEMKPTLEKVWSGLYGGITRQIFNNVPVEKFLRP